MHALTLAHLFLRGSVILLLVSPGALAAGPPIPLIVDPAGPPPLTLEEKVKLSSYVIVGEARRLVFLTPPGGSKPAQLMKDDPPHLGKAIGVIEVSVRHVFLPTDWKPPQVIKVWLPSDFSDPGSLRERYLGKRLVFFLRSERARPFDGPYFEDQEVFFQFARGRWSATPEDMTAIPNVRQFTQSGVGLGAQSGGRER